MITQTTLDFLAGLKANNSREWFGAHRPAYEAASADFFDTVAKLLGSITVFDPDIADAGLDPKSCIMRIYRDVRFSADKTPYKTGLFAVISKGGRKGAYAGYYLHLEPGASFVGGGLYMPDASILARTRAAIDSGFDEWRSIVQSPELLDSFPGGVIPSGETKRPPKGYDGTNPALHYLRYKGYYTQRFFTDAELLDTGFDTMLAGTCESVMPLIAFLNDAIGTV